MTKQIKRVVKITGKLNELRLSIPGIINQVGDIEAELSIEDSGQEVLLFTWFSI